MTIHLKRAYDPPSPDDGRRVLVDRLWPRGLKKEDARLDAWTKELGPSTALRQWFNHEPEKWDEFKRRYFSELAGRPEEVNELRREANGGTLTLVYASKDEKFNNAAALREYLAG